MTNKVINKIMSNFNTRLGILNQLLKDMMMTSSNWAQLNRHSYREDKSPRQVRARDPLWVPNKAKVMEKIHLQKLARIRRVKIRIISLKNLSQLNFQKNIE